MPSALKSKYMPPLPAGKTVEEVFGDFLSYLMSCAEKFIRETHAYLVKIWPELRQTAIFVIGHPNGWEGAQQAKMRRAAILAGLVSDTAEDRT